MLNEFLDRQLVPGSSVGFRVDTRPEASEGGFGSPGYAPSNRAALSTQEQQNRAGRARDLLMQAGWTQEQAAGIIANIQHESSFDPRAVGDAGSAMGLVQWHSDRRARIFVGTGINVAQAGFDDQVRAIDWELRHTEAVAGNRLQNARRAAEAGGIISSLYERPGQDESAQRGASAQSWMNFWGGALQFQNWDKKPTLAPWIGNVPTAPTPQTGGNTQNNSTHNNQSSVDVNQINIHTSANDARGIADDIGSALRRIAFVPSFNTGLA